MDEKYVGQNIALLAMLRDVRMCVWIEFVFDRLGVTNAQAFWLAQVGWGDRIGHERVTNQRTDMHSA